MFSQIQGIEASTPMHLAPAAHSSETGSGGVIAVVERREDSSRARTSGGRTSLAGTAPFLAGLRRHPLIPPGPDTARLQLDRWPEALLPEPGVGRVIGLAGHGPDPIERRDVRRVLELEFEEARGARAEPLAVEPDDEVVVRFVDPE